MVPLFCKRFSYAFNCVQALTCLLGLSSGCFTLSQISVCHHHVTLFVLVVSADPLPFHPVTVNKSLPLTDLPGQTDKWKIKTSSRVTNNIQREHLNVFDLFFGATLCVPTVLPASVNCPFVGMVLTLCYNEERRWWGGGAFTFMAPRRAHHCSILLHKAIRGPQSPHIMGDAFPMMTPYVDDYWLQPV